MRVFVTESEVKVPQKRGTLEGKRKSSSFYRTKCDACPEVGSKAWEQMFDFSLSFHSYKEANSYHPQRSDEGSERKGACLVQGHQAVSERSSIRTQTHKLHVRITARGKDQKAGIDTFVIYSGIAQKLCSGIFSLPLFQFLKSAQLICLTVVAVAWRLLCCVYIRKEAFSWNTFFQLIEERKVCVQLGLQLKPCLNLLNPLFSPKH